MPQLLDAWVPVANRCTGVYYGHDVENAERGS